MQHFFSRFLLCCALALPLRPALAQQPAWQGGAQTTSPAPTNDTGAGGQCLATDQAGNSAVGGILEAGPVSGVASRDFGTVRVSTPAGHLTSGFVAKLSAQQQWQWAVPVTAPGPGPSVVRVDLNAAGEVLAGGTVQGSSTLQVGALNVPVSASGLNNVFVARLNAQGGTQWVATAPIVGLGNAAYSLRVRCVRWDPSTGGAVVAGEYRGGTFTFGSTVLPNAPVGGVFVARLSGTGQWLSAVAVQPTNVGGFGQLDVNAATVGPQGQVAVAGEVQQCDAAFGAYPVSSVGVRSGNAHFARMFVAQLNPGGQWQFAATATGTSESYGVGVAYAPTGDLWVTGTSYGGNTALGNTSLPSSLNLCYFAARLSAAGQWGVVTPSRALPLNEVVADAAGNALIVGMLISQGSLGYTVGTLTFTATGERSVVVRLSPTGQCVYALVAPVVGTGVNAGQYGADIYYVTSPALDGAGNFYAASRLRGGPLVLGTRSFTGSLYNNDRNAQLGGDVLVVRLANAAALPTRLPADAIGLAWSVFPDPAGAGAAATVAYALPLPAEVSIEVLNSVGQAVGPRLDYQQQGAGPHTFRLPAGLAAGLYVVRLAHDGMTEQRRLVVE
jgi:hypothetical protein